MTRRVTSSGDPLRHILFHIYWIETYQAMKRGKEKWSKSSIALNEKTYIQMKIIWKKNGGRYSSSNHFLALTFVSI